MEYRFQGKLTLFRIKGVYWEGCLGTWSRGYRSEKLNTDPHENIWRT